MGFLKRLIESEKSCDSCYFADKDKDMIYCLKIKATRKFRKFCEDYVELNCLNCEYCNKIELIDRTCKTLDWRYKYFNIFSIDCKKEGLFESQTLSDMLHEKKCYPSCSLWKRRTKTCGVLLIE